MKKAHFILTLFIISIQTFSQTSLDVVITGECSGSSDTYDFIELFNGKNQYLASVYYPEDDITIDLKIGFDGSQWVLYASDITDFGFFNTNVTDDIVPPFIGWLNSACHDGTMSITQNTSGIVDDYLDVNISVFPNPTNSTINIKLSKNDTIKKVIISDLLGRTVKTSSNKIIDLFNLKSGIYLVKIISSRGNSFSRKILKL